MRALAALKSTDARIAEVRALEYMPIGALRSLLAISIDPKGSAYWVSWGMLGMNIRAGRVVAIALGEVNA